jgi:hypothetical protein
MYQPESYFDRIICRQRPAWVKAVVILVLLSLPFIAAYIDGELSDILQSDQLRILLLAPTLSIYIWLVAPILTRGNNNMVRSLRPLVALDDEEFDNMVREATHINPNHELIAIIVGVILGLATALANGFEGDVSWLSVYWLLSSGLMYMMLAWTIFISISGTRLNTAIHRQPLQFEILDSSSFEAVGRLSLLIALIFAGGIALSFLLAFIPENITAPAFWLVYLIMVLVIVLIFFLNMRPTHNVLVTTKEHELSRIQGHIQRSYRVLTKRLDEHKDSSDPASEINALVSIEQRIQAARTWPYNTGMLRTLFFSVLIPLGSILTRVVIEIFFR